MKPVIIYVDESQADKVRKIVEENFPGRDIKVITDMDELPSDVNELVIASNGTVIHSEFDKADDLKKAATEFINKHPEKIQEAISIAETNFPYETMTFETPSVEGFDSKEISRLNKAEKEKKAKEKRKQNTNALRYMNKHYKK